MSSLKVTIKMPCGFEYLVHGSALFHDVDIDIEKDLSKITCPLHGKRCKK